MVVFPASLVAQATNEVSVVIECRYMARASPLPVCSVAFGTSDGNVVGPRAGELVSPTVVGAAAPAKTSSVCDCRAVNMKVLPEVAKECTEQELGACVRVPA